MRKLASIQLIDDIKPILDADAIEQANVLGWTVVVKRGEFAIGDKCVFFEIDSVLPLDKTWAAFMQPRKGRVKTIKLRGCLSQGLALPLSILENNTREFSIDDDVTELLNVTKFEPPLPMGMGDCAGTFPAEIPKTDETRLQSIVNILDELKQHKFVATVKCDGMSGTFYKKNNELIVCSRNWALKQSQNSIFWNLAERYNLQNVIPEGFVIQGEVCGPGIQKNRLQLKTTDLFVFNVYDATNKMYLDYEDVILFCKKHNLKTVPQAFVVDNLEQFDFTLDNFLLLAQGKYDGTQSRREGIVVRPLKECKSSVLNGRFSFKVIANDFLLNDEE
jgi:RNA ligase (TIGR02306 family)